MHDASGVLLGTGYAGHGAGVNNPAMQSIHDVGPLPQGIYAISPPETVFKLGPNAMQLTPDPANEMFGRSGFWIHADEKANPGKRLASDGCIVMSLSARQKIWEAGDQLRVIV